MSKATTDKLTNLEYEIGNLKRELKETKILHLKEKVKHYTTLLLEQQEKDGKLDAFTIQLFLNEFATEVKNLENRGE